MISVPNLRPLLNGSKLILLLCLLFCFGCSGSKKTVKRKVVRKTQPTKKPKDKVVDTKVVKKDTNDWNSKEEKEEEREEQIVDSTKKDVYNVSLFIPFNVNSSSSQISAVSNKFINYYAGVSIALSELENMGISLNVKVFDSQSNFDQKLQDPFNRVADVLIGPYDKARLQKIAQFGKDNKIPVISPWKASKKITKQNPYYVQLNPNPSDHFKKIADHVNQNFSPDQVFLLKRENNSKDNTLARYIQRYHAKTSKNKPFNEFEVNMDSLQMGDNAYDSLFLVNRPTVFILPNYTSKDEDYVYNAVRRISTEKEMNQVYVYGMPILMRSNKFTYDYYTNLNLRTCISNNVDRTNSDVKDFESEYFSRYNDLPTDDAFEGYDMMMLVGTGLMDYGSSFQKEIVNKNIRFLQTSYYLEGIDPSDPMTLEKEPNVEYYQNMHLDIIQYQNDGFKRL